MRNARKKALVILKSNWGMMILLSLISIAIGCVIGVLVGLSFGGGLHIKFTANVVNTISTIGAFIGSVAAAGSAFYAAKTFSEARGERRRELCRLAQNIAIRFAPNRPRLTDSHEYVFDEIKVSVKNNTGRSIRNMEIWYGDKLLCSGLQNNSESRDWENNISVSDFGVKEGSGDEIRKSISEIKGKIVFDFSVDDCRFRRKGKRSVLIGYEK